MMNKKIKRTLCGLVASLCLVGSTVPVFAETEPTAFPIAIAECPFNAAAADTMISGIVVAKLTIVAPTTYFGIPRVSDIFDAASTNQSPPLHIRSQSNKKTYKSYTQTSCLYHLTMSFFFIYTYLY